MVAPNVNSDPPSGTDEDDSMIGTHLSEETMFFKFIGNEFATKMNLEVRYHTVQQGEHMPFVSSLVLNGKSYSGLPAKRKKTAKQFAACTAILSNLNDSTIGTHLSEVINSNFKYRAAINNVKDSQLTHVAGSGQVSGSAIPVSVSNNKTLPEPSSRKLQQEYATSKQEKCSEESELSDLSQQAGEPRHLDDGSSLKKHKKNKKKANNKPRMDFLPPVAAFPLGQAPPPVASTFLLSPPVASTFLLSAPVASTFLLSQPSCSVTRTNNEGICMVGGSFYCLGNSLDVTV